MPVGQSRAQPLQDRQRSSASLDGRVVPAADAPARLRRRPAPGARGRGPGWSPSRPGWRGTTGTSRRRRPCCRPGTCRRRCTGAPRSRTTRRRGRAAASCSTGRRGAASRRSASNGAGSTSTPGLSRSSGSSSRLACRIRASASAEYIRGSSSERARPSPCSPDMRAAVRRDQVGRVLDEPAEPAASLAVVEREVDPHVHAAVAEVAVGHAVEAVRRAAARRSRAGRRRAGPAGPRRPPTRPGPDGRGSARPARRRPRGSATARPARPGR